MTNLDTARKLVTDYIALKSEVDVLQGHLDNIKLAMQDALPPYTEGGENSWEFDEATVSWVKGRRSEKVDPKALRKALVLAGVNLEVLEKAFAEATSVTTGSPYLRVTRGEEE